MLLCVWLCVVKHQAALLSIRGEKETQGVITPQAWMKGTETDLSDSKVLTLPGGFEPATPKNLA